MADIEIQISGPGALKAADALKTALTNALGVAPTVAPLALAPDPDDDKKSTLTNVTMALMTFPMSLLATMEVKDRIERRQQIGEIQRVMTELGDDLVFTVETPSGPRNFLKMSPDEIIDYAKARQTPKPNPQTQTARSESSSGQ